MRKEKSLVGTNIYYFEELESTQKYLIDLVESGKVENFDIICTENQTKGIGRHNRNWESRKGDLIFSIAILNSWEDQSYREFQKPFNVYTNSLTYICDILHHNFKLNSYIKWPNDIFVDLYKIGGLIVDVVNDYYIIGIGLNTSDSVDNSKFKSILKIKNIKVNNKIFMERFLDFWKKRKSVFYDFYRVPSYIFFEDKTLKVVEIKGDEIICRNHEADYVVFNCNKYGFELNRNKIVKR